MYANELLDAYKKAKNYIQDKQIAHDLNLQPNKISKIRTGIRYLSDEEAIFLAEGSGIEKEVALLGIHADKNDNPTVKALWEGIAKKYNGLGLSSISMALAVFGIAQYQSIERSFNYALGCVMLNVVYISMSYESLIIRRFIDEIQRND